MNGPVLNTQSVRIPDPKHAALNRIEQVEWYKLLVESVQDYAIFLLDTSGKVTSWNKGAQKFNGYKAEEIIGKHFSVFYPEKDKKRGKPEWELAEVRKYGRIEDEGWRLRKDGSRYWANVVITGLYDNSGRLRGYAKVTRDLTERKKNEDALKEANRVLKHQQKELQKLNRSKDEFISLASHQLRTPATIVKQYLGILKAGIGGPLTPEQIELLEKADLSNERQIETINDLLRVAQIDAGKVNLDKQRTDVAELVKSCLDEQADLLRQHNQSLAFNRTEKPALANVDIARLRMAIENLVNNASKYTPDGGKIEVLVKTDNNEVLVSIADNGVGIKESDLPKLFKQFSRIHNELSEHAGGSGLGLYWANKVITLHGGQIGVTSKVGKGTTFLIRIPSRNK